MARRLLGFVFSLDAFVAFSLILIAIQSMVIVSSTPAGYWPSLLQADFLAKDTLRAAANTHTDSGRTVLSDVRGPSTLNPGDELVRLSNHLIRPPYSYAYSYYDLASQNWTLIYNASDPMHADPSDPRINITYRRVAASSEQLALEYSVLPVRPQSPWCNVMCHGWGGNIPTPNNERSRADCVETPCSAQSASAYQTGNLTFGLVRLTVWG
ncbi:Uncharacterised protein [uncultured archaeon]|nr:Uncharacterised protein [uncultured archaeon]